MNIMIMPCPVQRFNSSCLEFKMTFVEALWPILTRQSNAIVSCRDLESGGTLTRNHKGERTQEIDRQRLSTFGHTQAIFEKGLFIVRYDTVLYHYLHAKIIGTIIRLSRSTQKSTLQPPETAEIT